MTILQRGLLTWPGRLSLLLLLMVVVGGGLWAARHGDPAAAQTETHPVTQAATTPSPTSTRTVPTRTALPPAAIITGTLPATPTATAAALSPLAVPAATQAAPLLHVPLPITAPVPHVAPVGIVASVVTTTIQAATPTAAAPSSAAGLVLLPSPTPTPTPTLTFVEALEQPVTGAGGMAGIVAAATTTAVDPAAGAAPVDDSPPQDESSAAPDQAAPTEAPVPENIAGPQPTLIPQPTADGTVRTARVPILMYHYVSVPPAGADIYRQDLSVAPDLFAAHLDAISAAGYTPISLYALLDHLNAGAPLPEKPVVLTFDDGYRDNYENAFPRLRDRGLTATFFVVTDFIDGQRPEYLTWDMVREMYAAGMSIESHGRNHVSLKNKDRDYLIWQALGSFETIQFEVGVRPRFISYPAGDYDQLTIDIFRSADYWAGFTTIQGATHRSDDLFQLRRVRVRGTMNPEELLRILALDW